MTQVPLKLRRPRDDLRNHAGNPHDYDVVDGEGNIVGRIFKPGGHARDWMWTLKAVVRPPLRNHGYADTREQTQAAFRATWPHESRPKRQR